MLKQFHALFLNSTLMCHLCSYQLNSFLNRIQMRQLLTSQNLTTIAQTQQEKMSYDSLVAEFTKPTIVRIVTGCKAIATLRNEKTYNIEVFGHGSGFFVNPNGYIVTNAHVIELANKPEECKKILMKKLQSKVRDEGENLKYLYKDLKDVESFSKYVKLEQFELINHVILQNGEKLPFEAIASDKNADSARDVAIIKVNVKNAPALLLENSDDVLLREEVTVIGYPGVADVDRQGMSFHEPSFTDGKVSAKKYLHGSPVVQISAPFTHGNSGGPAVNSKGKVIGIATFYIPEYSVNPFGQQVSGFGFIVSSNTIKDFLNLAGIVNDEGLTSKMYREGLNLYSKNRCKQAMQKFQETKRLFSQHPSVDGFLQECSGYSYFQVNRPQL
ncbi:MAG: serine protease [Scytonema sp. PMC 1069.18]|nr:serine protease [Scytonema sp. PMC 1069.18]MEC4885934.1 serine protease [Scytonema sp. PMC 1070.18]